MLLSITHPYEIWKYETDGKRKYQLQIEQKKYLFLKALPSEVMVSIVLIVFLTSKNRKGRKGFGGGENHSMSQPERYKDEKSRF